MLKRYYLSEMAVSDQHGGGLTISRILQNDLLDFERFVHVDAFASEAAPIKSMLAGRQLNLHQEFPRPQDPSGRIRTRVERALDRLRIKTPHARAEEQWSDRVAGHIVSTLERDDTRWLVVPQGSAAVLVMNRIVRRRPVPYVTWVMDDHVMRWRNGWSYPPGFESEFRSHLQQAERVLVISPAMRDFYRHRFSVDAEVLFGPPTHIERPAAAPAAGPIRLAYFGAIRAWQLDALALLVDNLHKVGATLDLFGLQQPPPELSTAAVRSLAPVPAADVVVKMREYDGVVIAASFNERQRGLTEFNIATKLSECLASGTVTVLVAPPYAAMAQFSRQHGGAVVISDFNDDAQIEPLKNLRSQVVRDNLLSAARRTVDDHCSFEVMRQRWVRAWHAERRTSTDE